MSQAPPGVEVRRPNYYSLDRSAAEVLGYVPTRASIDTLTREMRGLLEKGHE